MDDGSGGGGGGDGSCKREHHSDSAHSVTQLDMQQDPGLLANRKGEKLRKG